MYYLVDSTPNQRRKWNLKEKLEVVKAINTKEVACNYHH